jgi:hypothetical protein
MTSTVYLFYVYGWNIDRYCKLDCGIVHGNGLESNLDNGATQIRHLCMIICHRYLIFSCVEKVNCIKNTLKSAFYNPTISNFFKLALPKISKLDVYGFSIKIYNSFC